MNKLRPASNSTVSLPGQLAPAYADISGETRGTEPAQETSMAAAAITAAMLMNLEVEAKQQSDFEAFVFVEDQSMIVSFSFERDDLRQRGERRPECRVRVESHRTCEQGG